MIRKLYRLFPDKSVLLKLTLLHVILALLQGVLLGVLVPILNYLLKESVAFHDIEFWLIIGAVAFVSYLALTVIATPVGFGASMKLATQLRNKVMSHVTQLPLGWFTSDNKARLARTLTADIGLIAQLAVTIGAPAIVAILVPASIIIVTFLVNWQIGLLFLIIMPLALFVLRWGARIAAEEEIKLERAATEIAGKAIELGQAQTVLRAAGKAVEGTKSLQQTLAKHRTVYRKGLQRAKIPFLSFIGAVTVGFIAVILLITQFFIDRSFTVSQTIILFILAVRFLEPLAYLTELIGALQAMDNGMNRVKDILQTPTLPINPRHTKNSGDASVRLNNITFAYDREPVIKNVSLLFPHGSTTALIGASGSGKTTLIRLIARFYDVDQGNIQIGQVDIRELDYNTMIDDIAIIFQDVYLFDTSIRENLLIAKPDATETELKEAASSAQLDEMLERLPKGWDAKVGEGGLQLSGGERQRVSIARAFLKKARIVLIDEAASALDPENEQAISNAIANISADRNRTIIIIAHRPATIQAANHIVVLENGSVIEQGSPHDLLLQNGYYAKFRQQHKQRREWKVE
uniref:Xenobiotic-transporting ATPase n=1 Tax=Sphingobacterium sp. (strain 21) TaxID=743722 RepID=F4CB50_SPHS2